jgi:hypothetical protein
MADEVKIVDVAGGPASEATLAELVKTLKAMGGGSSDSKSKKSEEKATKLYTDSVNKGTKANKKETKATKETTEAVSSFGDRMKSVAGSIVGGFTNVIASVANMGMVFTTGANTIEEFVKTVPVVGGVLGSMAGYFQNGTDTFRQLSAQGAAFGNNIETLRRSAAEAAMPLDMFANMVASNSNTLTLLGGTISEGAARMGKLSKEMRGAGFLEMGFTMEELNEHTLGYMALQARRGRLEKAGSDAERQGLQNYITQLDKLTKLTGMSRKEMEATMQRQAQEANVNAMLSKLEGDARKNFTTNLAQASELGPELEGAFKDLADGVAQTPLGESMAALSPEFAKLAQDSAAGRVTAAEFQERLKGIAPDLEKFRDDMGGAGTSALMGQDGLGELLSSLYKLTEFTNKAIDPEKLEKEQAERDKITTGFATFEQTIQKVKDKFQLALIESGVLDAVGTGLTEIASIFGVAGDEAAKGVEEASKNSTLTLAMENMKVKIIEITESIKTFIKDIANPDVSFSEALKKLFNNNAEDDGEKFSVGKMLGEAIAAAWENVDLNIPWGTLFIGGLVGIGAAIAAPVLAIPAGIAAAVTAVFGIQFMKDLFSDVWDTVTSIFTMDTVYSIGDLATTMWETVKGWFTFGEGESFSISAVGTKMWESVTGWFNFLDTKFSISDTATEMWNTVTGWFGFGEGEAAYSISKLASDAWATVKGWFGFGEDETFSISKIATDAWNTVTGWFNFEGMEMPSIKDMFQSVFDAVKGFFTFDFQMPNFKSYLPKWMGGEGKSIFGGDETASAGTEATTQVATSNAPSVALPGQAQSALNDLASTSYADLNKDLMNLKTNMDAIGQIDGFKTTISSLNELDNDGVFKYNDAVKSLNETFKDLNKTLSEDNKGFFGGGTGVAAADVVGNQGLGGNTGNQLNTTMLALLEEMKQVNLNTGKTATRVGGLSGDLQQG